MYTGSFQYVIKSLYKSLVNFLSRFKKGESSSNAPIYNENSYKKCSSICEEENTIQPTKISSTSPDIDNETKIPSLRKYSSLYPSEKEYTTTLVIKVNINSSPLEKIRMIKETINKYEVEIINLISVKVDNANQIITYKVKLIESEDEEESNGDEIKIPPDIPSESIFSYTKISLFNNCPKAYEFKYIKKISGLFLTVEQHLGRSVHSALKNIYEARSYGDSISLEFLIDAYSKAWNSTEIENTRVIIEDKCLDDYYHYGKNMLKKYYQRAFLIDDSETIELEKEFLIKFNEEIHFRGYIDRISKQPNGKLRLVDFKTGKRVKRPINDMQLCSYAIWAFKEYKEDEIEIVFEALKHEKTMISRIKRSKIPIIKEKLLIDINNIISTKNFVANPTKLCKWCAYNEFCDDINSEICPRCGGDLEEREGRNGSFIGCSKYPKCRYTREDW